MNVLLTGGAGYIGSHTCVELLEAGYTIVVADDFSNSFPEAMARVQQLTGRPFPVHQIDVCDAGALDALFAQYAFDAVIHFAGLKAVGESVQQPLRYYRVNLDAALTLAETMARHGVYRLVFSSSATVYDQSNPSPIDENVALGASNPYGWTKYMIERIYRDLAASDGRWSIALMRYFNPVGAHPSGVIGEHPGIAPNNLMPRAINAAYEHRPIGVFGDDYPTADGTCVRDYIHVCDLAQGHIRALAYVQAHSGAEAFNLGTGVGYSVLDVLKGIEQATGIPANYRIEPRRAGDIASYYADAQKARDALGWRATRTLHDMCRDAWNFKVKNPEGY